MSSSPDTRTNDPWTLIETEKQRDRTIRRISTAAWSVTFAVLLFYGVLTGVEVVRTIELMQVGAVDSNAVFGVLLPFVKVVGAVALLIAVLSTIGIFLRLRTASLSEIQLRLAALENILLDRPAEGDRAG